MQQCKFGYTVRHAFEICTVTPLQVSYVHLSQIPTLVVLYYGIVFQFLCVHSNYLSLPQTQSHRFEYASFNSMVIRVAISALLLICIILTQTTDANCTKTMEGNQDHYRRQTRGFIHRAAVAGTNSTTDFTQASANDSILRDAMERELLNTPRFLFRTWREDNGDCRTTDTRESVTPTMLKDLGRTKPTIYDIPRVQLVESARSHLNAEYQNKSYFSSWTHSWQHLSSQMDQHKRESVRGRMEDVYIGIIDTKQLKKVGVVVIRSSFFRYLDADIPEIAEEYLAFGKICGMGYDAASLKDVMESNALLNIAVGPWPHYTDLNEAIEGARLFGSCFGPYFALPMAITLLSFPDDKLRQSWTSIYATSFRRVIKGLERYHVPEEWSRDGFSFGPPQTTPDSNRATLVLDELSKKQSGSESSQSTLMETVATHLSRMDIFKASSTILDAHFPNDVVESTYCPSTVSDTETMSMDDDEEEFARVALLPPGRMDVETKKKVLASQRKTPRFLFRGWCNSKWHPSGGDQRLNTKTAITPRAFLLKELPDEQTIYDLSFAELHVQALSHLQTQNFSTQLSSWASSLKVALFFGAKPGRFICDDCHISIIDTALIGNQNVFLYVPSLEWLSAFCRTYRWEYLAHGVIKGPAHKAIPLKYFINIGGLPERIFGGLSPAVVASPRRLVSSNPAITAQELQGALRVAEAYGGDFVVPVTVAILCQQTRDDELWRSGSIPGLSMVADALKDHNIPQDWCTNADILTDVVDSGGYGDVDQMIRLLRALLHYRHGKGARVRSHLQRAG